MLRGRLFVRREVVVPTWQGWLVIVGIPVVIAVFVLVTIYPFLSTNRPLGRGILVVEGWMSKRQLATCAEIARSGAYDSVFVTGGPIAEGTFFSELYPQFNTIAEVGAHQLASAGLTTVVAVPRPEVAKDRTYHSGLALRKRVLGRGPQTMDVVSEGPHARRSWMLYAAALDGVADVGILAVDPIVYDPERWWTKSSGVRSMIGELLAYGYATFLFYPNPDEDLERMVRKEDAQ